MLEMAGNAEIYPNAVRCRSGPKPQQIGGQFEVDGASRTDERVKDSAKR